MVVVDNGSEELIVISQRSWAEAVSWALGSLRNTMIHEFHRSCTGNQGWRHVGDSGKQVAEAHGVKAWVLFPENITKCGLLSDQALLEDSQPMPPPMYSFV